MQKISKKMQENSEKISYQQNITWLVTWSTLTNHLIIVFFENVYFFLAKLGLDVCPYEAPPYSPFRLQTMHVHVILHRFSSSLPIPLPTSHPYHLHISTGWHPIVHTPTPQMPKPLQLPCLTTSTKILSLSAWWSQRLRLAHSCILARVLLHTGACANAALLTYLLTKQDFLEMEASLWLDEESQNWSVTNDCLPYTVGK